MRRRSVLASAAALLGPGLAGCLGGLNATGPTTTRADPQSAGEQSLSVAFEGLQPAVVVLTDDGPRVVGDGHQYLFCRVDVTEGEPPERLALAFRLGGNVYSPGIESAGRLWREAAQGGRYGAERGTGWLVFELPAAWRAEHAALSLRGAEWPVGPGIRERLAATPPSMAVEWRVEPADSPERTRFGFSVANGGEYDSRFVATVTEVRDDAADALVAVVDEPIPGGETVSWTTTRDVGGVGDDGRGGDGSEREFALSWLGGRRTAPR